MDSASKTQYYRREIKQRFQLAWSYLVTFFPNPLLAIRQAPNWDWATNILVTSSFAIVASALSSLMHFEWLSVIFQPIYSAIINPIIVFIISAFFYYSFLFFFRRTIEIRQIFTVVVLASAPVMLLSLVAGFFPPVALLGYAFTCILLVVGFYENFQLPKRPLIRFMGALFAVYAVFFIITTIRSTNFGGQQINITPESLDILKEEYNDN